jgi:hypothetical protein
MGALFFCATSTVCHSVDGQLISLDEALDRLAINIDGVYSECQSFLADLKGLS